MPRSFTEEEKKLIIQMYNNGETQDRIRETLRCKSSTLVNFLRDNGYKKRPHNTLKDCGYLRNSKKYHVNASYFDSIDTPEKAYWLGFLYADGCVRKIKDKNGNEKGGVFELSLCQKDLEHLYNFAYDVSTDAPIKEKIVRLGKKEYCAVRLSINDVDFVKSLISQGCVPAKTFILQPPNIAEEFIPHFCRGYFDGDGSVSFNDETKSIGCSILGTKDLLEFIKNKSGISKKIHVTKVKNENVYSLLISGVESLKQFYKYIYQDKPIFLYRKYEKFLKIMKHLNADTCRSETAALADLLD